MEAVKKKVGRPKGSGKPPICGTTTAYRYGCRCVNCRNATIVARKAHYSTVVATPEGREKERQRTRKWQHSANGKSHRKQRGLATYGLTLSEYELLLKQQDNVCAICKQICTSGRALAVDHDHATGKVRGLLCGNCNIGLGKFKDNEALVQAALVYLTTRKDV